MHPSWRTVRIYIAVTLAAPIFGGLTMDRLTCRLGALLALSLPLLSFASSHREAPNIAGAPRVDGTDVYLFRSYEVGRQGFVTVLANYIPFQDPAGGPN